MLFLLAYATLSMYLLWVLYVFTMAMLRAKAEGKTNLFAWTLAFPVVVAALALDILLNYTLFALLTLDFPKQGEYTFSQRLGRLVKQTGWRACLAKWVAQVLLDDYDHTGKHVK